MRSEILGQLVDTLTPNYEYSHSNRENLAITIQTKLCNKLKTFCTIWLTVLESIWNFQCSKKNWASEVKYFWSYWLQKMCLFKCITGFLSENPLAVNELTNPKNSWNLKKSTFILFFLHSVPNSVRKS